MKLSWKYTWTCARWGWGCSLTRADPPFHLSRCAARARARGRGSCTTQTSPVWVITKTERGEWCGRAGDLWTTLSAALTRPGRAEAVRKLSAPCVLHQPVMESSHYNLIRQTNDVPQRGIGPRLSPSCLSVSFFLLFFCFFNQSRLS